MRLRDFATSANRAGAWWQVLSEKAQVRLPARALYVGGHWSVVRQLPALAMDHGFDTELWVASAGYGLAHEDTPMRAYSATFAARQHDSIAPSEGGKVAKQLHEQWWEGLTKRRLPGSNRPRSVAELAKSNPEATILVVGFPNYVAAMRTDLLAALNELDSPTRLLIVSSEQPSYFGELEHNLVPTDARLLRVLGNGNRVSLHALAAKKLLHEATSHPLDAGLQRLRFRELLETLPAYRQPEGRAAQTDLEVKAYIWKSLSAIGTTARSQLLRQFRASGRKCEQKRFKRLFDEVTGTNA